MKIREVIERHGMTMAELAKKRGQTNSAVVQLVKGNPTMSKLRELAQDVGCNFWEFIEDEIEAAGYRVVKDIITSPAPVDGSGAAGAEQHDQPTPSVEQEAGHEQAEQQQEPAVETKAEEARVLRFTYDCPHCGHVTRITIE
jgi:transcriptional regulator with XRE-family HTH domain